MIELTITLLLGLAVGSFLNVVIERTPRTMVREWHEQAFAVAREAGWSPPTDLPPPEAPLSLASPASHCPKCRTPIRWYHNIPLLSYALLRGRCKACEEPISWHYPAVEALTGLWFVCAVWWWGPSLTALAWMVWGSALIALSVIDARTQYLPDEIGRAHV